VVKAVPKMMHLFETSQQSKPDCYCRVVAFLLNFMLFYPVSAKIRALKCECWSRQCACLEWPHQRRRDRDTGSCLQAV